MDEKGAKRIIEDGLEFYLFKLRRDECSVEEIKAVADIIARDLDARGTIKEFADFYGQSESNVRNVINRRYIPEEEKPERNTVTYRFGWFASMVPSSWRRKTQ